MCLIFNAKNDITVSSGSAGNIAKCDDVLGKRKSILVIINIKRWLLFKIQEHTFW